MFRELLTDRLRSALASCCPELPEGFSPSVSLASDTRFGDYQSNAAMVLGKQLRCNPRELAGRIAAALEVADCVSKVSVDGPGFLNFTLSPQALESRVGGLLEDASLGVPKVAKPKRIVIDFSAPNIAKPMHVGHIRSTFIGDALARMARWVGHEVITDNHVGDWGTQFGMILQGWKTGLNEQALKQDPIAELVRVYRSIHEQTKTDAALLERCKAELVKLQGGDSENLAIWRECVRLTLEQLQRVYEAVGISFDHYLGESFYNEALGPLVERLLREGIARLSDGAVVVFSDGALPPQQDPFLIAERDQWKAAPCIVRKSDGGFLYATTDLATIAHRIEQWQAQEIWYVVGAPQQLHFRQVFAVARRMGAEAEMVHIAFGSILGPDGRMFKTRSGETVGLLEVLDEAVVRAQREVDGREHGLSEQERTRVARQIGVGAVKYAELSQNRLTDYQFSWEKMLSMQGNTAPYLMNAYVRTRSIFRKLDEPFDPATARLQLQEPAERALGLKLCQLAEVVHDVLADHRPNLLANYLFELANAYHAFYEACPVLKAEPAVRASRLQLCEATSRVLKGGLGLLGIEVPERM